ncbi:MAG: hypothetical protein MPJ78_06510, partial [Hyphomicrobiaceae bacterium]|nr:hypothetical protein [Hyphomicrobiaceae bacterium]
MRADGAVSDGAPVLVWKTCPLSRVHARRGRKLPGWLWNLVSLSGPYAQRLRLEGARRQIMVFD